MFFFAGSLFPLWIFLQSAKQEWCKQCLIINSHLHILYWCLGQVNFMVLPSPGQKGRWQNNSLIVLVKLAHIITAESSVSIVLDLAPAKMNLFFSLGKRKRVGLKKSSLMMQQSPSSLIFLWQWLQEGDFFWGPGIKNKIAKLSRC